jgi:DNA-binding winged helix-turn-helix (wHTH) protein
VGDEELPLTTQLFDLLVFFLDHGGAAVSFQDLATAVWSYPPDLGDHHFLHTAVYRLRRILNTAGVDDLITGIRGFGYRIKAGTTTHHTATPEKPPAAAVFDPADPELRLSMVNDAAVQLTGYDVASLTSVGGAPPSLWDQAERAAIDDAVRIAVDRGHSQIEVQRLTRSDGSVIPAELQLSRLDLPGRDPLCLVEINPLVASGTSHQKQQR